MPTPRLFPTSVDGLLYRRRQTLLLAAYAADRTRLASLQIAWAERLSARIAEMVA